jgi:hypothetical protein
MKECKRGNSEGEPHPTPNAHSIEGKDRGGRTIYMVSLRRVGRHLGHVGRTVTAACYQYQTEDSKIHIPNAPTKSRVQAPWHFLHALVLVRAVATHTLTGVILRCRAWRLSSSPALPLWHHVLAMMDLFVVHGGAVTLLGSRESQCSRWSGKLKDWE